MKFTLHAAVSGLCVMSLSSFAAAAEPVSAQPSAEQPPDPSPLNETAPDPATIHDGRGDVLAFEIDHGLHPKYLATVRCKNGRIGHSTIRMEQWQEAVSDAFVNCETK